MRLLVTGANGFVGKALCRALDKEQYSILCITRKGNKEIEDCKTVFVESITDEEIWGDCLEGVETIVHLAGRAHKLQEQTNDPLKAYREINTLGTLKLAEQAKQAGVKRFIFISSIKVNGESTEQGVPFTENDRFIPSDPYGLSKYEAEQSLLELGKQTGMEIVIIRPPLIYGPGVKANFAKMMKWVKKGIPLPFGAVNNLRSLVALDNLIDFVDLCVTHPKAANEIFLISDSEDVSTTMLLNKVAEAYGKTAKLLPIPTCWMTFIAKLLGKAAITDRLFSSLQVDSSKARNLLGWTPIISMDEQLKQIVDMEK